MDKNLFLILVLVAAAIYLFTRKEEKESARSTKNTGQATLNFQ